MRKEGRVAALVPAEGQPGNAAANLKFILHSGRLLAPGPGHGVRTTESLPVRVV